MATINQVSKTITSTNDVDGQLVSVTFTNNTANAITNLLVVVVYKDTTENYSVSETITLAATSGTAIVNLGLPSAVVYAGANVYVGVSYTSAA